MEIAHATINLNKTPAGSSQNLIITQSGNFAVSGVIFSNPSRDLRLKDNGDPFLGSITVSLTSTGEVIASLPLARLDGSERTVYIPAADLLLSRARATSNAFEILTDDVIGDGATVRVAVFGELVS